MMAAGTIVSLCCGLFKRYHQVNVPQVDTGYSQDHLDVAENVGGIVEVSDLLSLQPFPLPVDVLVIILTSLTLRDLVVYLRTRNDWPLLFRTGRRSRQAEFVAVLCAF